MRPASLLGNPGQAVSPGAETNASRFRILFVAELWGVEGNTTSFPWGESTCEACSSLVEARSSEWLTSRFCPVRVGVSPLSPQEREVGARGPLEQHQRRLGPPVSGPWSSRGGGGEVRQADSKLKFQKINRLHQEPGIGICILYAFALIS